MDFAIAVFRLGTHSDNEEEGRNELGTTFSVGFVRLLIILNEGFQNYSFYRVGVNNKLVKLIQFSLTKLSYKLMVVTTSTSETVFDGLLN